MAEILKSVATELGNTVELIGEDDKYRPLIIGVFHGDEPQGKYLIEKYLEMRDAQFATSLSDISTPLSLPLSKNNPTSESKIPVLPQGEDINLQPFANKLRNNMTKQEVIMWQHLKQKQVEQTKFRRQQQIGPYICDFVSFEKKLIIELDGGQHNEPKSLIKDKIRDNYLKSEGYRVLRFWNDEILNNLEGVILRIKNTITSCPPPAGGPESTIPRWGNSQEPEPSLSRSTSTNLPLFIPCLNPDGLAENKRTNANGVDLNRNFPTKNWGKNEGENATCDDETTVYYGGNAPASEVETQFVIDVIEKYSPSVILTLHAPYKVVNYDGPAKEIAELISEIIDYPTEGSIGYPTPGSFGTYCGVERNIPTITLELDEEIPVENLIQPVFEIFDLLSDEF